MVRKLLSSILLVLPIPAMAQSESPPSSGAQIQDFIAGIPPVQEVPYEVDVNWRGVRSPVHREHMTYHFRREDVVAYRFIRDRNARDGRDGRGQALDETALTGFTEECAANGGYLEPSNQRPFEATLQHLFDGAHYSLWHKRLSPADPFFDLVICSASPDRSLGALTVTRDHLTHQTAIVLFAPSAVVTQADLDRERAAMEAQGRREVALKQKETDLLSQWRQSIANGSETACGPVLSTNGEMVEVVDTRTRQPSWYRRGELLPAVRLNGEPNACR